MNGIYFLIFCGKRAIEVLSQHIKVIEILAQYFTLIKILAQHSKVIKGTPQQ